ncbi:hypothetical protein [Natronomonas sp.]|jgi:hypothetical protein|uniref:DUF7502 family protein n=1 Tax=Natronomonas sp. TaxID=2184060 RepID=UPI003989EA7D
MSEPQQQAVNADREPHPREELLAAVSEISREAKKAAFLQAALDAMLVFVVLRLALQLTPVGDGSGALVSVPIPGGLAGALSGVGIILPDPVTVTGAGAATVLTAVSWFVADAFLRYDRLGVERFEADNPVVEEALRTARDTAEGDVDNPVAVELYREVLGRLEDTSSRAFVQRRQLVAVVVGLALVSAATVGVAGLGLSPIGTGGDADVGTVGGAGGGGGAGGESSGSGGGEDLLGEEGEVERGTDDRSLQLRGEGEGQAGGGGDYSGGSFDADPGRVEASRAEFSEEERPEDAELVRAYTERIRGGGTDE